MLYTRRLVVALVGLVCLGCGDDGPTKASGVDAGGGTDLTQGDAPAPTDSAGGDVTAADPGASDPGTTDPGTTDPGTSDPGGPDTTTPDAAGDGAAPDPGPADTAGGATLGVTVSGLTGTLVLQNQGGDDLTLDAPGTHAFATTPAPGAAYDVTVLTQPSGQTCKVRDPKGTMPADAGVDLEVRCEDWTCPGTLDDAINPTGTPGANALRLAMDAGGDAIALWLQPADGGGWQLFKSELRSGTWTHPPDLQSGMAFVMSHGTDAHDVGMADNGEAVITWGGMSGGTQIVHVYRSQYRDVGGGATWTHPADDTQYIDTYTDKPSTTSGRQSRLAVNAGGDAVIAYLEWPLADEVGQVMQHSLVSGGWAEPSAPADSLSLASEHATNLAVALGDNGDAVIVYAQRNDTSGEVELHLAQRRGSSWSAGVKINPAGTTYGTNTTNITALRPHVAIAPNGDTVVAAPLHDGTAFRVYKSEYRGGAWTHPADAADAISPPSPAPANMQRGIRQSPRVAMSANGDAVVVWVQNEDQQCSASNVCERVYLSETRGGAWAHPADLADYVSPIGGADGGGMPTGLDVAMDAAGHTLVVWSDFDGLFKSEYRGGQWHHPWDDGDMIGFIPGAALPDGPAIAMSDAGTALLGFVSTAGSTGVYLCTFAPTP